MLSTIIHFIIKALLYTIGGIALIVGIVVILATLVLYIICRIEKKEFNPAEERLRAKLAKEGGEKI